MNARLPNTGQPWVDSDDAPELTEGHFQRGTWSVGDKAVSKESAQEALAKLRRPGRPPAEVVRPSVTMRLDADVLARLRASGKGWQTRVNAILREAVESGRV